MSQPILTNPEELETWLEQFITEQMSTLHVPGVTFSAVQNGKLFFAKGYGYADIEKQIPVEAENTVFRVGAISMLLTTTAIMQLVEQELIGLDDDLNQYLPHFQIDNNFSQPVTIKNLLTQTAGFDRSFIGMSTFDKSSLISWSEYLATKMPQRVRPPGKAVVGGCNYSHSLLGYLVELITQVPYAQYIEENILQPLEMNHTSFDLPSSDALNLASSYRYLEKKQIYQAYDYEYTHMPTASINTTATDFAKLEIAHLQYGKFKSQRILSEATARQMQQQQFTNNFRFPGMGWGFWELTPNNNQRILGNGGAISGFTSLLFLMPEHNLGLLVSSNGRDNIPGKLMKQFVDRYFPLSDQDYATLSALPKNQQNLKRYEGSYRSDGYPKLTLEKISVLFSTSSFRLQLQPDGTLTNPKILENPNSLFLEESEPLVLQVKDSPYSQVLAQADTQGKITNLISNNAVFNKLAWYETNTFHWILIISFILIFISGLVVSILALVNFPGDFSHQLAQMWAGIICGLNLVAVGGLLTLYQIAKQNYRLRLIYGLPKIVPISLSIFLLTSVLAVGLPVLAILPWINHDWSLLEKLHYSLISLTAVGFIRWLDYLNLLGFRY